MRPGNTGRTRHCTTVGSGGVRRVCLPG
jgi:hypothetical protein